MLSRDGSYIKRKLQCSSRIIQGETVYGQEELFLKIIIVEGIPGSGKSSTARFISLQSERNGLQTELFHESTFQHPIFLEHDTCNSDEWKDAYLSNWSKFLKNQASKDSIIVMESVLLQSPIINLLHMDIDRDEIIDFIVELGSLLSNTDCSLIYLYQNNPSVGINRMMAARGGETWLQSTFEKYKHHPYYLNREQKGKELHLDFLHEYSIIANKAFSKCTINSLAVENSKWEWDLYHKTLLDFLEQSYYPDPNLTLFDLEKFVGLYRSEEMGLSIQVEMVNDELIIFGNQKIKPRDINKFYLDNISMSLEFVVNGTSNPQTLIIYEKDIVGNRHEAGTKFKRIS